MPSLTDIATMLVVALSLAFIGWAMVRLVSGGPK
jgi:hypothetical protein